MSLALLAAAADSASGAMATTGAAAHGAAKAMRRAAARLDTPALILSGDPRGAMFRAAPSQFGVSHAAAFDPRQPEVDPLTGLLRTSDPRARLGRAAPAQTRGNVATDRRAEIFFAGPHDPRRGVSEVPLTDPRLATLVAFAQMTWRQLLSGPGPGRSHTGKHAAPIEARRRFVKPGGFFSERE